MTIEPGVVVKFDFLGALTVYGGTLNIQGTSANNVYFTSIKDDSLGGDTNEDGNATVPNPGDWEFIRFIRFYSTAIGNLNYAVIRYAGRVNGRSINNDNGNLTIFNSQIVDTGSGSFGSVGAGIVQFNGSSTIISTEFSNQNTGFYLTGGTATISQSSMHDNFLYGARNTSPNVLNAKNNWWGFPSGPFHPTLNPSGTGNGASDNVDFISWLTTDPLLPLSFSDLGQFKSDGTMLIAETGITTEDAAVFSAKVVDPAGNNVKFQVELRPIGVAFSGADDGGILSSDFFPSGSAITITKTGLANGQYHWRARAINGNGNISAWQEFGFVGNTDFEIKTVPLYTQVESEFPSLIETQEWFDKKYASGDSSCGSNIAQCGCAIASAVMNLRYYGVISTADAQDVNPLTLNAWLNANNGYTADGNVIWPQIVKYANGRVKFDGIVGFKDNMTLDNYLTQNSPVILYQAPFGHFILADGKLSSTYTVRDPRWYETKNLADARAGALVKNYNNNFTSLRLFSRVDGEPIVSSGIYVSIASPAELLLTDAQGRKSGKDPISGISYNEIAGASYYYEGINGAEDNQSSSHESKVLWIPQAPEGKYQLSVIGTGEGNYTLDSLLYDANGDAHTQTSSSTTNPNLISDYNVNFTPSAPENMGTEFIPDTTSPEATLSFDINTSALKVEGTDNRSIAIVEQNGNNYTVHDAAGNTLALATTFSQQNPKTVEYELTSLQYNSQSPITLSGVTLKFVSLISHKTGQLSALTQTIDVLGQFQVVGKYSSHKNATEITVSVGSGKNAQTTRQTVSGLAIIKLRTQAGILSYAW